MKDLEIREQLIEARDEYIGLIKAELMGPGSEFDIPSIEKELISSSPLSRYSVGILFPQGNLVEQDNDETVPVEGEETINEEYLGDSQVEHEETKKNGMGSQELSDDIEDDIDEEINMATQYKPSSMGMTVLVLGKPDNVHCKLSFATYRRALLSDCFVPYDVEDPDDYNAPEELSTIVSYDKELKGFKLLRATSLKEIRDIFERDKIPEHESSSLKNALYRLNDFANTGYVREPHVLEDVVISFDNSDYADKEDTSSLDGTMAKLVARRVAVAEDVYSLTVMLVNELESFPAKANQCLFQSQIIISSENNKFRFVRSDALPNPEYMDEEECSLEMLYRNKGIYGTGLGTSVEWKMGEDGQGKIWTEFFPVREIPSMSFSLPKNDKIQDQELSMKYLSDLDGTDKANKLDSMRKLVGLYSDWISNLRDEAKKIDIRYVSAAARNISECEQAAKRMYEGIATLEEDPKAFQAFQLANRAMFMQRIHIQKQGELFKENADRYAGDEEISKWLNEIDYYGESDEKSRWRPFQIAFLLMDINSIVNDEGADRSLVDLIWFPTGGGKTEAYLGLTAFTIFYKLLAHLEESNGTTVIMRYTLRLLAAQQFTRAATLICACEYIRQDCLKKKPRYNSYALGKNPITIGLWIGGTHIPNKNTGDNSAESHLNKLLNVSHAYELKSAKEKHNKFQVLKCPWCGTKLVKDEKDGRIVGSWGYALSGKHFYMFCPHEDCIFTNRLPIQIIDEELYLAPPTLLFGTVDKFAMMAWEGKVGNFFGLNRSVRTPELIIQDELHLISGALGTMVGLYETAIDGLASMKGVKPKIIASTATIRRAKEQCSALYNREVVQFPAPGLNAEDSFFAKEDNVNYSSGKYGRKYVGIMPSGRTKAMTEIRAMAALLQKAYTMDLPFEVKDKLWTLTVYFNSLKDLGKASNLVDDDVKDFIIRTANRMFTSRRLIVNSDELTSRVSTTELNETLDKLEKIEYSKENIEKKKYASNILLATNMISVGIDVARLNVMLMVGQPKLTSEYIQASSRVGRSFPGVTFIQYDATKSRDRSHYERFCSYHDSFYRFVEPTGVTPFSKPARDRALHAVVATLLRQKESMIDDNGADYFDEQVYSQSIKNIEKFVVSRIRDINSRSSGNMRDDLEDVSKEIWEFFDYWQNTIDESHKESETPVCFGRKYMVNPPVAGARRLFKQYNSQGKDDAIDTLTSMRNVDTSVRGSVMVWED